MDHNPVVFVCFAVVYILEISMNSVTKLFDAGFDSLVQIVCFSNAGKHREEYCELDSSCNRLRKKLSNLAENTALIQIIYDPPMFAAIPHFCLICRL